MKKKIAALLLALAMIFALAACGSSAPAPTAAPTAPPTEEPAATEEPAEEAEPEEPAARAIAYPVRAEVDTTVTAEPVSIYSGNGVTLTFDGIRFNEYKDNVFPIADFTLSNNSDKVVALFFHKLVINGYVDSSDYYTSYEENGDFNPGLSLYNMTYLGYEKAESFTGLVDIQFIDPSTYIIEEEYDNISFEIYTDAYTGENTAPVVPETAMVCYEDKDITVYGYAPEYSTDFGIKYLKTVVIATGSGEKTLDFPLRFSYMNGDQKCTLNGKECGLAYRYDYTLTDQSHYAVMNFTSESTGFYSKEIMKELKGIEDVRSYGFDLAVFNAETRDFGGIAPYLYTAD